MNDLINLEDRYETRDGREVEVLKLNMVNDEYPVVVVVTNSTGRQHVSSRTLGGLVHVGSENPSDLVKVKPRIKQTLFINVYVDYCMTYLTRDSADDGATTDRLACIELPINCEYGEGL